MKKAVAIVLAMMLCLALVSTAGAEKIKLNFSTTMSQEQTMVVYFDKALDLIEERTNGDITFARTYSGTLGNEHELGVMVTAGDMDVVCVGPGQWSDWDEAFKVFDCPYLFKDYDNFDAVLESPDYQAWLKAHGDPLGITFVMTSNQGFKGLINKQKEIYSTADLAGLKLRTPDSASLIEIGNAMGYIATPVAAADQYMSLSQGIVDGADHALWAHQSWKLTEIAKNFSDTNHALQACFLVMNSDKLASLSEEYQKIVLDTFAEVEKELNAQVRIDSDNSYAVAAQDGVKVIPYEDIDIESFKTALAGIIDTYSKLDPELYALIQACAK